MKNIDTFLYKVKDYGIGTSLVGCCSVTAVTGNDSGDGGGMKGRWADEESDT